jgi:hypothetical protein
MLLFTAFYTRFSGLVGRARYRPLSVCLKMGMVIVLAILAVNAVGGIDQLKTKITAMDARFRIASRFLSRVRLSWMPRSRCLCISA